MRYRRLAASGCAVAVLSLGAAACGGSSGGSSGSGGSNELTIYSSLPLQGTSRGQSQAVINGEKLALEEAGSKVGKYHRSSTSRWTTRPRRTRARRTRARPRQNARKAVQDKSTIFYLGEFNSGGTKVSLPILNKAGIPQISPVEHLRRPDHGRAGLGAGRAGQVLPDRKRTYARVVPARHDPGRGAGHDHEGGRLQVRRHLQRQDHVRRRPRAQHRARRPRTQGLTVEGNERHGQQRAELPLAGVQGQEPTASSGSGVTGENGVQVFKDVAAASPTAKLYGPDGVAEEAFTNPEKGGIPADVGARIKITVATLGVEELAARPGRGSSTHYKTKYGVGQPGPVRHLRLRDDGAGPRRAQARRRQGGNDREAVRQGSCFENTKDRKSVLGTYRIDKNGDTTLTDYGLYTIKNGLARRSTRRSSRGGPVSRHQAWRSADGRRFGRGSGRARRVPRSSRTPMERRKSASVTPTRLRASGADVGARRALASTA